ncbi:MAG: hypothetical protein OXU19_03115, partial [bacterium]|nr:hypothetical protein [bacterium]
KITISATAAVLAGVSEGRSLQFSLATDADDGFDGGQDVNVSVVGDPSGLIDPSDRKRTFRATATSGSEAFMLRTLVDPGSGDGTVRIEVLAGDGYEVGAASKIEIPVKNDPDSSGRLLELKDGHTSSAMEGNGLLFEFSLSGTLPPSTSSAQPQVQVSTVPSGRGCTATASAEDYREYSRTKKFIDSKITVIVVTTNDNFHERDETVCLKIHEPRYLVLPGNRKEIHVSGTIRDNDPLPTVSVSSPKASESADTLTFEVTLDKPPHEKDLTVAYSDSGRGTATPGKDHDAIPAGTLTFSRLPIDEEGTRDTRKTVTVPLVNDSEAEADETVVLRLNKVRNGRLDGGGRNLYGTGTITDDERILPTLTFRNGGRDAAVQEGGRARIRVDLRDGDGKLATLDKDVAFTWSTVAFTAQADDFTAVSKASATLPAGQTGVAVEVQTLDDSTDEAVEYFQVRLDGVAENVKGEVQVSSIGATVPIHDGPTLAVLDAGKRTEGQPLEFHVTLGAAAPADVEVAWKTETATGQTAAAGKDYTAASGTLTISAGKTGGIVRVRTLDDALDEPDEDLSVVLVAPFPANVDRDLNYAAERERATGVIRDDDARPRITMADVSTTEGGKLAFKAVLDKASGKPVRLGWATAPSAVNGATFGKDYRGRQAGEITIRPGGKEARIEFVTVDDDLDEPDETFKLRLYDREAVPGLEADA